MAYELCPFPKFRAFDSNGDPLSGGKLYTYEPGTSTPKATYDENNSANANPVILDSNGEADVYLNGKYKLRLDDSNDVTQWIKNNIPGIGSDYYQENAYYVDSTATDQGAATVEGNRSVKDLVDSIGTSSYATIIFKRGSSGNTTTFTFTTSETIPSNIKIIIENGAILSDGGGSANLNINGPFEAGNYKVFDWTGSGSVSFGQGAIEAAKFEWMGALGDGSTDDAGPMQKTINSLPSVGGKIKALNKKYKFGSTITFSKPVHLVCDGYSEAVGTDGATTFLKASTLNGTGFNITSSRCMLENFLLDGESGNGGDGIVIGAGRVTLKDVSSFRMGADGISIGDGGSGNYNLWNLHNIYSKQNGGHGVAIEHATPGTPDVNAGVFTFADLQGNTKSGLYLKNTNFNTFVGITSQTNTEYGIHCDTGSYRNTFFGGDLDESNVIKDLQIESGAIQNMFLVGGMEETKLVDSGTANFMLFPNDGQTGIWTDGFNHIGFGRPSANYVRATKTGGLLYFITDGEAVAAANAHLAITTAGVILGKSGTTISKHLSATGTWDPVSIADGNMTSTTVTVTGAAIGNTVAVGFSTAVPAGALLVGAVTATDTVTVTLFNKTGGILDLASGTLRADVWQH